MQAPELNTAPAAAMPLPKLAVDNLDSLLEAFQEFKLNQTELSRLQEQAESSKTLTWKYLVFKNRKNYPKLQYILALTPLALERGIERLKSERPNEREAITFLERFLEFYKNDFAKYDEHIKAQRVSLIELLAWAPGINDKRKDSPENSLRDIIKANVMQPRARAIALIPAEQLADDFATIHAKKDSFPDQFYTTSLIEWIIELTASDEKAVAKDVVEFYAAIRKFLDAQVLHAYGRLNISFSIGDLLRNKVRFPWIEYLLKLSPQELKERFELLVSRAGAFLNVDQLSEALNDFEAKKNKDNARLASFARVLNEMHGRIDGGKTLADIFKEDLAKSDNNTNAKFCVLMRPEQIVFDMERLRQRGEIFSNVNSTELKEAVEAEQARLTQEEDEREKQRQEQLKKSRTALPQPLATGFDRDYEDNKSCLFWNQAAAKKAVTIIGSVSALTLLTAGITHFIPGVATINLQNIISGLGAKFVLGASMGSVTLPWMLLIAGAILAATAFLLYVGASINKTCKPSLSRRNTASNLVGSSDTNPFASSSVLVN